VSTCRIYLDTYYLTYASTHKEDTNQPLLKLYNNVHITGS